jgi:hypothetical protein
MFESILFVFVDGLAWKHFGDELFNKKCSSDYRYCRNEVSE